MKVNDSAGKSTGRKEANGGPAKNKCMPGVHTFIEQNEI